MEVSEAAFEDMDTVAEEGTDGRKKTPGRGDNSEALLELLTTQTRGEKGPEEGQGP